MAHKPENNHQLHEDDLIVKEENEIEQQVAHINQFMEVFEGYDESELSVKSRRSLFMLKRKMARFGKTAINPPNKSEDETHEDKFSEGTHKRSDKDDIYESKIFKRRHECSDKEGRRDTKHKRKAESTSKLEKKSGIALRKMKKKLDSTDSDDSEESTEDSSEDETEYEQDTEEEDDNKASNFSDLTKAIKQLDFRKVPEIEAFEEDGDETLPEYLVRFEKYCSQNIRGDKTFWLGELKTKLTGETLKTIQTITEKKDTYKQVKQKLLDYDRNTVKIRKKKRKTAF